MEVQDDSLWARRVATWLPRLADPSSQQQAAEALLTISMERYQATPKQQREAEQAAKLEPYKAAVAQLSASLNELIPAWISTLVTAQQEIQRETDERVAALRRGDKLPKFHMGQILSTSQLTLALQAAGERIDPHLDPLIAALGTIGREGDDRFSAAMKFAGPGIGRATASLLVSLRAYGVWSSDSGVRDALARAAKFDPGVVQSLRDMLHEDDTAIRTAAASVLGAIGNAGESAADDLMAMESGTVGERITAIHALAKQSPPTPAALALIERALRSDDGYIRRAAAHALGQLRAEPDRFIPQLIAACDEREELHDESVPEAAVWAMTQYGPLATDALPRLRQFLTAPLAERTVKPKQVRAAISAIADVSVDNAEAAVGITSVRPTFRANPAEADETLYAVADKGRLCYVDRTGAIVIQTEFEHGEPFHGNRAIVRSKRQTSVIDRAGRVVFQSTWRDIKPYHEGFAAVKQDKRWGFVDEDGRVVVEPQYDSVTRFSEGMAGVELGRTKMPIGESITLDRPGRRGFIDRTGRVVIPMMYEDVQPFSHGRSAVCLSSTLKANPLLEGRELPTDRKYGLLNSAGEVVMDGRFNSISPFSEGLAAVHTGRLFGRERHGYINPAGEIVLPLQYTSAGSFRDGFALVRRRGHGRRHKQTLIDRAGNVMLETDQMLGFDGFYERLAAASFAALWGVIDVTGKVVIEPQFDEVGPFIDGIAVVTRGDWYALIGRDGRCIWGPTTEWVYHNRTLSGEWV